MNNSETNIVGVAYSSSSRKQTSDQRWTVVFVYNSVKRTILGTRLFKKDLFDVGNCLNYSDSDGK